MDTVTVEASEGVSTVTLLKVLKMVHEEATKHRNGKRTANWFNTYAGICYNARETGYQQCRTPNIIFQEWASYSGDIQYPVPSPKPGWTPRGAFYNVDDCWVGEYGDLRMDLLNHCIKTLEKGL